MAAELARIEFTEEQVDLMKRMLCNELTNDEFAIFAGQCRRTGLDPFAKQIHAVKRQGKLVIQTGIDGYRLIADRTGKYAGNDDPVFDNEERPTRATVTVYKMVGGVRCPFTATARWNEYFPGDKLGFMWKSKPCLMLGKCAESLALRKAFPAELSGVYTDAEMDQAGEADDHHNEPPPAPAKQLPPAVDPRKADYDHAAADLRAAAAKSCDRLKAVWGDVFKAGPAVFGENLFGALELLKDELKAKCQQTPTKPTATPATGAGWAKQFESDAVTALSVADLDALQADLNDHAEHLTDAEYKRCVDALNAAYTKLPAVQAGK